MDPAPGYNCRAHCWLGEVRVDAVYDTGSTRSSIDRRFLQVLIKQLQDNPIVTDVVPIKPIICKSVAASNPSAVKNVAYMKTTFKESQPLS